MSFFHFEGSWWEVRNRPNVLLVHYNDLKADLSGEMTRIADFLGVPVDGHLWPELVEAAQFDTMRRDGATLMSNTASIFREGSDRFFFKGTNDRWRGVFSEEDLALYDTKIRQILEPNCVLWITIGRLEAGDPRLL